MAYNPTSFLLPTTTKGRLQDFVSRNGYCNIDYPFLSSRSYNKSNNINVRESSVCVR